MIVMYSWKKIYEKIQLFVILKGIMETNNKLVLHSFENKSLSQSMYLFLLCFDGTLLEYLQSIEFG
jgi:hypothetical protein